MKEDKIGVVQEPISAGVPAALRRWFVVHFAADILFALPLFVAPEFFLMLLGWQSVDPVSTRLFAAALFGIGVESLLGRGAPISSYLGMLRLKLIFSATASIGLLLSALSGGPVMTWAFLAIFVAFHLLWLHYFRALRR